MTPLTRHRSQMAALAFALSKQPGIRSLNRKGDLWEGEDRGTAWSWALCQRSAIPLVTAGSLEIWGTQMECWENVCLEMKLVAAPGDSTRKPVRPTVVCFPPHLLPSSSALQPYALSQHQQLFSLQTQLRVMFLVHTPSQPLPCLSRKIPFSLHPEFSNWFWGFP